MIVAVLGANGQLGSDIVRAAGAWGKGVKPLALTRTDLDVTDFGAIREALAAHKFDVLVNCTSYHKTDEVEAHATEAFRINAHAVAALAEVCKARYIPFVHISTDYVFDGNRRRPYSESDSAAPVNVYGASKLLGETLAFRAHGDGTLVARVASLFGIAGSSGKGSNFVETILRKAKESGEVRVVDDITMSPTSTADAARVILGLVQKDAPAGIYHVVNSDSATWYELAREVVKEAGCSARVVPTSSEEYPTVAARPRHTVLDNRKSAELVGGIPSWRMALRRYMTDKGHMQHSPPAALGAS